MNNQVLELLKKSSGEVRLVREKKDLKKAKEKDSIEKLIKKSRKNAIGLYRFLLRKAIHRYMVDPASVLISFTFVPDNSYTITHTILNDSELKGVNGTKLAEKHNENIHDYSDKNRIVFYSEEGSKPIPVMIDTLDDCSFEGYDIVVNFTNEFIRNLTIEAHEKRLHGVLYDKFLIALLQYAYTEVKRNTDKMNDYLERLSKNAQLIYFDCYKKLLKEYEKNNKESSLYVCIKNCNNSDSNILLFNKTSLSDQIIYGSYDNEYGELTFVPVQLSVLRRLFEQDSNIGFKTFLFNHDNCIVEFDTVLFEDGLIQMNKEEESNIIPINRVKK